MTVRDFFFTMDRETWDNTARIEVYNKKGELRISSTIHGMCRYLQKYNYLWYGNISKVRPCKKTANGLIPLAITINYNF